MDSFCLIALRASLAALLPLAACARAPQAELQESPPARVERLDQGGAVRLVLTDQAVQRLGIETQSAGVETIEGGQRLVVPYAAILYDTAGAEWVYTNSEPLTFVRTAVQVDFVAADKAVLLNGPPAGTPVVTVGAEELFGAEVEAK